MIIRVCDTCHEPRWAKTYRLTPAQIKAGQRSVAKRKNCKRCRYKAGEREMPRKPRPKRVKMKKPAKSAKKGK
jgi:hypothetical protein